MTNDNDASTYQRFDKAANMIASAAKKFVVATSADDTTYTSAEDQDNPYIRIPLTGYCLKVARDLWRDVHYPPIADMPPYEEGEGGGGEDMTASSHEMIGAMLRLYRQLTHEDRLTVLTELNELEGPAVKQAS